MSTRFGPQSRRTIVEGVLGGGTHVAGILLVGGGTVGSCRTAAPLFS